MTVERKTRAIQGEEMENSHDKDVGDIGVLATAVYVRSAVTILFLPGQCVWVEARFPMFRMQSVPSPSISRKARGISPLLFVAEKNDITK